MPRVALITGASQGIGKAIAIRLAQDGLHVALNDLPVLEKDLEAVQQELFADSGKESLICIGDVTVESEVIRMIELTVQRFGSLDVMIANAGICITKSLLETTQVDLHRLCSVNVDGTFLCYKHAALQMIKQGKGGRIIGASSLAGKQGQRSLGAYGSTKFAVRGLTQTAAVEWAKYGITVNAYAPGGVTTEMLSGIRNTVRGKIAEGHPDYEMPPKTQPTESSPKHIAGLVSYLISEEAEMITGQSVSINGGRFFD